MYIFKDVTLDFDTFMTHIEIPTTLPEGQQRVIHFLPKFLHSADEQLLQAYLN